MLGNVSFLLEWGLCIAGKGISTGGVSRGVFTGSSDCGGMGLGDELGETRGDIWIVLLEASNFVALACLV